MRRALFFCVLLTSCEKHEFHPATREERMAEADSAFAATRFDTISWTDDDARMAEGNVVFAARCRRCHGATGLGDGDVAVADSLRVPSLLQPEWRYDAQPDSLRRRIFIGHYPEMRTWGIAGLAPREIDAVAWYVVNGLRPEMLGDTAR